MLTFLAGRILRSACVVLSASLLCFGAFHLAPGDFFVEARISSNLSAEAIDALRKQYGTDRSLFEKYGSWASSVFKGQWGESLTYGTPVWPIVRHRALNTIVLSSTAMMIAWLIAIPLCLRGGLGGPRFRSTVEAAISLLNSVPDILIALLLMALAAGTGVLPVSGMSSLSARSGSALDLGAHLALPAIALALTALPPILAHGLAAIRDVGNSQYVRAAQANGVAPTRLLTGYVLRGAANPLISLFGLSVGALLSSTFIVEAVMGWPGIGRLLLEAALQRDVHVVLATVVLSSILLVSGNLLADLLLYLADPRIRNV